MSSKPPFHHLNGRRPYVQRSSPESPHIEVTKYIHDSWKSICREMEVNRSSAAEGKRLCNACINGSNYISPLKYVNNAPSISYYSSNMPDEQLPRPDFKPFDLDAFLERRSLSLQASKQQSQ